MVKPKTYQYFAVEARRIDEPNWPWELQETRSTLRAARITRNKLALQKRERDSFEWRVLRVVQLVEEMDAPRPVTGQRGGARG